MADSSTQSGGAVSQATANQILQALNRIGQQIASNGLNTATTAATAGASSGLYLPVTVGSTVYKIALLNNA